jgi:hypothetical protein
MEIADWQIDEKSEHLPLYSVRSSWSVSERERRDDDVPVALGLWGFLASGFWLSQAGLEINTIRPSP